MDGQSFVVEWSNIPSFCGPPGMRAGQPLGMAANCGQLDQSTSTFQMILYPSGEIKLQYRSVLAPQALLAAIRRPALPPAMSTPLLFGR